MLFLVVLVLFGLLTAGLVYRYDLYEHEPVPLLAVAVALGAAAMWAAGRVEEWALAGLVGFGPIGIAAVAALTEEPAKLLVVVAVALLARREFDDPMDGIVYGSMAGLGMALEESVFYLGSLPATGPLPVGELVRLWAHVVLGGIVGFPVGFWRSRPLWSAGAAALSLAVAAGLHFAWDVVVLSAPAAASPSAGQALVGVTVMGASLGLYGGLVACASHRSRQRFAPGSPLRLWGWPFTARSRRPEAPAATRPPSGPAHGT